MATLCAGTLALLCAFATLADETTDASALIPELKSGGYVIVMRHASSPRELPAAQARAPGNTTGERQLDDEGIATATAMGAALKRLAIPIGDVWSSPTFRARQTAKLAGLPEPKTAPEIGDGGQSMQRTGSPQAEWLRKRAATPPPRGTNTLLITHAPNMSGAFGAAAAGLADGEALVFRPDGSAAPNLVGRVKIEDWPKLAR
jgi:phosphohistidine phosphatase SixA